MNYSFNLIDQPWVPCVTLADEYVELSLYDLLANAHQLREIACETPIMTASILPVTLALLHRIFGPEDTDAWELLWQQGAFPMSPISEYLDQWYERFDLFHPEYPFYQVRDDRVQPKSVLYLAETIANTPTIFDHRTETYDYALTAPEAARTLVTSQAFRLGGGVSGKSTRNFIDSAFTRGILFFATGSTVFQTLLFNLLPYPAEHIMLSDQEDRPNWERGAQKFPANQVNAVPKGYLDYLTWQTNNILLIPEMDQKSIVVRQFAIAPVMRLDPNLHSPLQRYIRHKDKEGVVTWNLMQFSAEKALWRDYHGLIARTSEDAKPPAVVDWLRLLIDYDLLKMPLNTNLEAIGLLTERGKPGKPFFYRQEQLPLPANLLSDEYKVTPITHAITKADQVCDRLVVAARVLAERLLMRGGDRKPDGNDITSLLSQWDVRSLYWSQLESPFWDFIIALSNDEEDALDNWYQALRHAASSALTRASQMSGTSAPALHGQVAAERKLKAGIRKIFESSKE